MGFLTLVEGGGGFLYFKTMHFALKFFTEKTMHFALGFIYNKADTLCYIFFAKNNALFVTFISKTYPMVRIPNYKCTYDQSDQIDK